MLILINNSIKLYSETKFDGLNIRFNKNKIREILYGDY